MLYKTTVSRMHAHAHAHTHTHTPCITTIMEELKLLTVFWTIIITTVSTEGTITYREQNIGNLKNESIYYYYYYYYYAK